MSVDNYIEIPKHLEEIHNWISIYWGPPGIFDILGAIHKLFTICNVMPLGPKLHYLENSLIQNFRLFSWSWMIGLRRANDLMVAIPDFDGSDQAYIMGRALFCFTCHINKVWLRNGRGSPSRSIIDCGISCRWPVCCCSGWRPILSIVSQGCVQIHSCLVPSTQPHGPSSRQVRLGRN